MSQIDHSDLTSKLTEYAATLGWDLSDWSLDTWTDGTAQIELWAQPLPAKDGVSEAPEPPDAEWTVRFRNGRVMSPNFTEAGARRRAEEMDAEAVWRPVGPWQPAPTEAQS